MIWQRVPLTLMRTGTRLNNGFRGLFIALLLSSLSFYSNAQNGFTDKSEAENKYIDSLKEGKWIELVNSNPGEENVAEAQPYWLIIYKAGKPEGMVREYYDARHIKAEIPYKNGKRDGTAKEYFVSGIVGRKIPYKNDKIDGVVKEYYLSGELRSETPYKLGKRNGVEKDYYVSMELNWE